MNQDPTIEITITVDEVTDHHHQETGCQYVIVDSDTEELQESDAESDPDENWFPSLLKKSHIQDLEDDEEDGSLSESVTTFEVEEHDLMDVDEAGPEGFEPYHHHVPVHVVSIAGV